MASQDKCYVRNGYAAVEAAQERVHPAVSACESKVEYRVLVQTLRPQHVCKRVISSLNEFRMHGKTAATPGAILKRQVGRGVFPDKGA